jgi:secreted trypsin-like serine protease
MKITRFSLPLLVSFLLLGGCGTQKTGVPSELKIIGGSPADAKLYPAVALIRPDSEGIDYSFCSGVLISEKLVLTAAHCSLDAKDKVYAAEKVSVMVGDSTPEKHLDKRLRVNSITVHPSFDRSKMAKDLDGSIRLNEANDLAVWELATPATGA